MNAPTNSSTRVNEIDFLRFFAAFLVMLFHYSSVSQASKMSYPLLLPIASFGFYGVHLFFMISGFVILMTAARVDAKQFIISRIIRLYPAFWVCCTSTSLLLLFTSANSDIFGTYYS